MRRIDKRLRDDWLERPFISRGCLEGRGRLLSIVVIIPGRLKCTAKQNSFDGQLYFPNPYSMKTVHRNFD